MFRIIFTCIFILYNGLSYACETYQLPVQYKDYFNKLKLTYEPPRGKFRHIDSKNNARCSYLTDLNGDGIDDFVAIYKYTGEKKRSNDWLLDLIIMYSEGRGINHIIYPYAGRYLVKEASILQSLSLHDPGVIDLMPGKLEVKTPVIIASRSGKPAVTYYWNKKRFSQQAMGVDD